MATHFGRWVKTKRSAELKELQEFRSIYAPGTVCAARFPFIPVCQAETGAIFLLNSCCTIAEPMEPKRNISQKAG